MTKRIFVALLFFTMSSALLLAQHFRTSSTPASCGANGTLTITPHKDFADTQQWNLDYSLSSTTDNGLVLTKRNVPRFENIAAGTYTLRITATSIKAPQATPRVVDEQTIVIADRNQYITASWNQSESRRSYTSCATGSIVLNVAGGKDSNYYNASPHLTFFLAEVPTAYTGPRWVKAHPLNERFKKEFRLEGETYPPGRYLIDISDGCTTKRVDLTLNTMPDNYLPSLGTQWFETHLQRRTTVNALATCNTLIIAPKIVANGELHSLLAAHGYEIALTPEGETPTEEAWRIVEPGQEEYAFSLGHRDVTDYYQYAQPQRRLTLHFRLRECHHIGTTRTFQLHPPSFASRIIPNDCNTFRYEKFFELLSYRFGAPVCYPLTFKVFDATTQQPLPDLTTLMHHGEETPSFLLQYGRTYRIEAYSANGKRYSVDQEVKKELKAEVKRYLRDCTTFRIELTTPLHFCALPYRLDYVDRATGAIRATQTINTRETFTSPPLDYNVDYNIVGTPLNIDHAPSVQLYQLYHETQSDYAFQVDATRYPRGRHSGYFTITQPRTAGHTHFVITGPEGFRHEGDYTKSTGDWQFFSTNDFPHLPLGDYTLVLTTPCGTRTLTAHWRGSYDVEDFAIDRQRYACDGLRLRLRAKTTLKGAPLTPYFTILEGQSGGFSRPDRGAFLQGEDLLFTRPGRYVVGVTTDPSGGAAIEKITVNYTLPPFPTTDEFFTISMACDDTSPGHILIKAKDGIPFYDDYGTPRYRYTLYDPAVPFDAEHPERGLLQSEPNEVNREGVAHFIFGHIGQKVVVRTWDACGNQLSPRVMTIDRLRLSHLLLEDEREVCMGSEVRATARHVGQQEWFAPDGHSLGTSSTLSLPHALPSQSGTYHLVVTPPFCGGTSIRLAVPISIHPCFAPVNPHLSSKASPL